MAKSLLSIGSALASATKAWASENSFFNYEATVSLTGAALASATAEIAAEASFESVVDYYATASLSGSALAADSSLFYGDGGDGAYPTNSAASASEYAAESRAAASNYAAETAAYPSLNSVYQYYQTETASLTGAALAAKTTFYEEYVDGDDDAYPTGDDGAYPTGGSGIITGSAALASIDSIADYYATETASLTGSALAAETSFLDKYFEDAEDGDDSDDGVNSAWPTGSAALSSVDGLANYYATETAALTGSALAAEESFYDKYYGDGDDGAYLTGSAAVAQSAAEVSLDNYFATEGLTGSAYAAATAALPSEIAAETAAAGTGAFLTAYPTLTGSALAAYSQAVASYDSAYGSYATAAPTGSVDKCGPKVPDPTVPDSCDTPVEQVDAPAAYGVQCLNDTQSSTPLNITTCATLIVELCSNQWQSPGQWIWLVGNGCTIGSFMTPFDGAAPWPTQDQCEQLIYAAAVDSCQESGEPYNIAAVNLKTLPDNTPGGSGAAVNVGYGSYVVANRQLRTLSDEQNCTWIPPDNYCQGDRCYPPSYYQSKYEHPTPCAAVGSAAATFKPLK